MVRDTSIKTYRELEAEGVLSEGHHRVVLALKNLGEATDQEIKEYLKEKDPNTVRPRRKELTDLYIVMEAGKRKCLITNRLAYVWKLRDEPLIMYKGNRVVCDKCKGKGYLETQMKMVKG